jgi:hypothetical protein
MTVTITITISDAGGVGEVSVGGGGGSGTITGPGEEAGGGPSSILPGGVEGAMGGQWDQESAEGPPPMSLEQLGLGSSVSTAADPGDAPPEDIEDEDDASEALDEQTPLDDIEEEGKAARSSRKKS